MAPVQSRLVLAVTIPAAALAIFLSLFWLRRASKGHPPSPPDIPDKENKEEEALTEKCDDKLDNTEVVKVEAREVFVQSFLCESEKPFQLENTSNSAFVDSSFPLKSDLSNEIDIQLSNDFERLDKKSQLHVREHFVKEVFHNTCVTEGKIPYCLEEAHFASGDKVTITEKTPAIVEVQINSANSETIVAEEIEPVQTTCKKPQVVNIPVNKLEETIVAVENKENESASVDIKSKTDKNQSDKKSSESTKMITEEASPIKLDYHKETDVEKSDLSEKLANLELDTMKLGDVDVKERDSANHSPSENMLASPSMSNFSDAHSEGSSDSGKGHSDGTTSPSRTPAGGSSVSGDPSPSIYEFVIPQVIVGRLIGRHGVFLHEIMSETHTSIFIKVHPETVKLKICAIEGSQQDIDKALEKIRKKFPLRRYPKLTLERVSFVPMTASQQLRAEDFHLQLIEGVNNDVVLSSLLSPSQFFVQQPCHPSYPCLTPLTQTLTQAYSTTDAPPLVNPVADAICVCPSLGGWYRAQIVSVDEDARHCDIKFVDYGGYLRVETSLLKQIRADFLMLPFQAVECSLANIQPIHESGWSEEARLFIHNITFGRILQAQVVSYTESGIPLVNVFTGVNSQVVLVNAELVSNGFATFTSTPESGEDNNETIPDQVTV